MMTFSKKYSLLFLAALALLAAIFFFPPHVSSDTSTAMTGYAWSDTIGWIDLNCSNSNVCASRNFGFTVAPDGTVSGYAWSDSIGWISANASDVSGCPSGSCTPTISHGALTGWLKAIGATGGWDGWISLSGSGYGPTLGSSAFTGYAWGSTVVGWVDFSLARSSYQQCSASTVYTCSGTQTIVATATDSSCNVTATNSSCVAPAFCSTGSAVCLYPAPTFNQTTGLTGHLQIVPVLVPQNDPVKLFWNVGDVSSCSVTGTNGDHWSGTSSGSGGVTSAAITQQVTFTLTCAGLDSSTLNESQIVNVVPVFQER